MLTATQRRKIITISFQLSNKPLLKRKLISNKNRSLSREISSKMT